MTTRLPTDHPFQAILDEFGYKIKPILSSYYKIALDLPPNIFCGRLFTPQSAVISPPCNTTILGPTRAEYPILRLKRRIKCITTWEKVIIMISSEILHPRSFLALIGACIVRSLPSVGHPPWPTEYAALFTNGARITAFHRLGE